MEALTSQLAKFVIKTSFDDLPESVVHTTKQVLIDAIGCKCDLPSNTMLEITYTPTRI